MPYSADREALHTELLTAIYARFRDNAEWPRLRVIELELDELLYPAGGITEVFQEIGGEVYGSAEEWEAAGRPHTDEFLSPPASRSPTKSGLRCRAPV
jgi:hypothetical protein